MKDLRVMLMTGGLDARQMKSELDESPPHIIVGCPGRVYDMIRRKNFDANQLKMVVLDEADEMLSHGFKDQVYNIFQTLHKNAQLCLFSATLPSDVIQLSNKFMREPIRILVKADMLTLEGIAQYYIALENDDDKFVVLKDLFGTISVSQCIIYCNSKTRVNALKEALVDDGFPVGCIHSGMEEQERRENYQNFKKGEYRVLISSNVTARGIDIQQVATVINFDVPNCVHTYLHRIGRSGRWGRKGTAINFVTKHDYRYLKAIEKYYSTQIEELPQSFVQG